MSIDYKSLVYGSFIKEITESPYFRGVNVLQFQDGGAEIYISFQTLLKFLDDYINVKYKSESSTELKSIVKIDWETDKPFFAFTTSVSFNLLKCYLHNSYVGNSDGSFYQEGVTTFQSFNYFETGSFSPIVTEPEAIEYNKRIRDLTVNQPGVDLKNYSVYPTVGNINYIYLNIGYLATLLVQNSDISTSSISMRKFLQDTCDGISKALGSINDFQVILDEEQKLTIVDFNQKRIKGLANISKRPVTTIKAQGLGSFVTALSAQSSITPDIATTITIGAQAQGNQLGVEATSFSRLSKGFTDSIYTEKSVSTVPATGPNSLAEIAKRQQQQEEQFQNIKEAYVKFIENQIEPPGAGGQTKNILTFKTDEQLNLENVCTDLYKALIGSFTAEPNPVTAATFIPVKVDLSLSGLSGIKIFQRFTLSGDVLPYIYVDNFDFVITGVTHEITNTNKWVTKLSAIIALKEPD